MHMRRALALLCALFCIWSSLFSAAFAVEIPPDLDDLGIDPWGDLGLIQETPEPTPTGPIGEPALQDPVELEPVGDGDIALFALPDDSGVFFRIWQGSPALSNASNEYYLFTEQRYRESNSAVAGASTQQLRQTSTDVAFVNSSATPIIVSNSANRGLVGYMVYGSATRVANSTYFYKASTNAPYGNVVHFTNLGFDKYDGAYLAVYGHLVSDIKVGYSYVYNSTTFYDFTQNSSYNGAPAFLGLQWSIDGENFFDLPEGSTYDYATGAISLELPIENNITNLYLSLSFGPASTLVSNGTNITSSTGKLFYKLDYSDLTIKAVAGQEGGVDAETKGLLATIISWLTAIRDGILNVGTAIAQLPGKIANLIIEGIKSLFIPSEEDLNGLKDKYQALLSERLGFIWQAGEWITSFGSDLLSALSGGSEAEFVFPGVGFDMNGEHYQLIEQQTVDFDSNGIVTVIRPFVGTIVALVVVAACVNLFHDMVGALISGKSYFDFLKGGGG